MKCCIMGCHGEAVIMGLCPAHYLQSWKPPRIDRHDTEAHLPEKRVSAWRKKTGIAYQGRVYSVQELADIRGMSRRALIYRLKTMSIEEAMTRPIRDVNRCAAN